MKPYARILCCFAACGMALGLAGCKKEEAAVETSVPMTPEAIGAVLPGGAEVLTALQNKDYEGMVGGLARLKMTVTEENKTAYRELRDEVLGALIPELGSNPAAKQAYADIGRLEHGR